MSFPPPDNPPAFPSLMVANGTGMTLRDYFAAKLAPVLFKMNMESMIGAVVENKGTLTENMVAEGVRNVAASAYQMADALLKEREKR